MSGIHNDYAEFEQIQAFAIVELWSELILKKDFIFSDGSVGKFIKIEPTPIENSKMYNIILYDIKDTHFDFFNIVSTDSELREYWENRKTLPPNIPALPTLENS